MTIHKHFVILSATSAVPANDNQPRIVRYANLEPFKRVHRPGPN